MPMASQLTLARNPCLFSCMNSMGSTNDSSDEPLTPSGRLFLQKDTTQVIHCAVGMKNPIDLEGTKASVNASAMVKHPRFCSLMVRDSKGIEHWRTTEVEIDRHFVVVNDRVGSETDDETAVNDYLAGMAMSPEFAADKPLWEIHVLTAHRCVVLRIHHALGDGVAMVSMFLALCRQVDDPGSLPTMTVGSSKKPGRKPVLDGLRMIWFTIVFMIRFLLMSLWVRDPKIPISGGDGVELWPRKLATARLRLHDMKSVKKALPGSTINDVLFGIISLGLCQYMDQRFPGSMRVGKPITGVSMVNLRKQLGIQELDNLRTPDSSLRFGNRFGIVLLPLYYKKPGTGPLEHITGAKEMLDRKKNSMEAPFSYWSGNFIMMLFGPKLVSYLNKRLICNTTFTISNIVGPLQQIAHLGNPITYIRANSSSLAHSITMHMTSYAGRADLQILVAKDIIPDPEFLADCFETALEDMKVAAEGATMEGGKGEGLIRENV